jgi:hypothetical protein
MYHGWYFVAEMWQTASPQVEGSLVLLVFMFFWVLMAGIERLLKYHSAMWQSRSFLWSRRRNRYPHASREGFTCEKIRSVRIQAVNPVRHITCIRTTRLLHLSPFG